MLVLYDVVVLVFLVLASPYYLYRMLRTRKYRAGLRERFGLLPEEKVRRLRGKKVCWIHSVSVGEVHAAAGMISRLKRQHEDYTFVVSTVTGTGQARARALEEVDEVIYLPLDIGFIIHRVFRLIHPEVFVIVETELWPRLIFVLHRKGVPVLVVNGRISDRSFKRYRQTRLFWSRMLPLVDKFAMQSEEDGARVIAMGAPEENVVVHGNMKFDQAPGKPEAKQLEQLRAQLGLQPEQKLWLAGSTHPGEEQLLLEVYEHLRRENPDLRLLLAPRHVERAGEIESLVRGRGFDCLLRSEQKPPSNPDAVIVLDTMGELSRLYALADYVFIGKSLIGWGGQNPLEAAAMGCPIVFGPHMENFREAESVLLENEGAVRVSTAEELEQTLRKWLNNPRLCHALGENALKALQSRQGATGRNAELISGYLDQEA